LFSPVLGLREKQTPVADVGPVFPNTMLPAGAQGINNLSNVTSLFQPVSKLLSSIAFEFVLLLIGLIYSISIYF